MAINFLQLFLILYFYLSCIQEKRQKYDKIIVGDKMKLEDVHVNKELKIIFMGTPEFSVPILKGLIDYCSSGA